MSSSTNNKSTSSNLIGQQSSQQMKDQKEQHGKSSPKSSNSSNQDRQQKESPHELVPSPGIQSNLLMKKQPSPTEPSKFYSSSSGEHHQNNGQDQVTTSSSSAGLPPVQELESKKRVIKNDIQRVLSKYDEIKHRLFVNKERLIDNELSQLEDGSHPQLKRDLDELDQQRQRRLKVAHVKLELIKQSLDVEMAQTFMNADRAVQEGKKEIRRYLMKQCQQHLVQLNREQRDIESGVELHLSHIELPLLSHVASNGGPVANLSFPAGIDSLKHHEINQDFMAMSSR